jgi:phosphoglycerol transferase MdoB-like AlkP superfamily enzyme
MPHSGAQHDWQRTGFGPVADENLDAFRAVAAGRNIILVSLESTAAQYLGLYGAQPDVMPNLTRLAASGIVFDRAYAAYPESIKGLYSVLCSAYPAFDVSVDSYEAAPCRSLPAALSERGYATALFHSGASCISGWKPSSATAATTRWRTRAISAGTGTRAGIDEPSTVRRCSVDRRAGPRRPFFSPICRCRQPYIIRRPTVRQHDEFGRYRNAVHEETALGTLMRGLQQRGSRSNRLIVFGDHGEAFGQHEATTPHVQSLRGNVRCRYRDAGTGIGPASPHRVVSLVDIAPTVLDLAGLAITRPPHAWRSSSPITRADYSGSATVR